MGRRRRRGDEGDGFGRISRKGEEVEETGGIDRTGEVYTRSQRVSTSLVREEGERERTFPSTKDFNLQTPTLESLNPQTTSLSPIANLT